MQMAQQTSTWEVTPVVPFLNPNPIAHLVGQSNEVPVFVNGEGYCINWFWAQVSSVSSGFWEQMALKFHPLDWLLELEGTVRSAILYLGYVEVNLQIPGIRDYNEDILLLVIPTTTYSRKVPVMLGSKIIDRVMGIIMRGELAKATVTWKQAHFGADMSRPLQLPHKSTKGNADDDRRTTPSVAPNPPLPKAFCLDGVQGHVCTTQESTIPPFGTINIHHKTDIQGHCMWVHLLNKPAQGSQLPASIVPTAMYDELHPCSSWVPICLRNLGSHPTVIPAKVVVGKVTPANKVPPVVLLMGTLEKATCGPKKDWILEELDLQGLEEWAKEEQEQARKLLVKWEHLFSHNDLDLGKLSNIKHQIELTN